MSHPNRKQPHRHISPLASCGAFSLILLAGCGGGGGGSSGDDEGATPGGELHSIIAKFTGLNATVELTNHSSRGIEALAVSAADLDASGNYQIGKYFATGESYTIVVSRQPFAQTCIVINGQGVVGKGDVNNIEVSCVTDSAAEPSVLLDTFAKTYTAMTGLYALTGVADPIFDLINGRPPCLIGGGSASQDVQQVIPYDDYQLRYFDIETVYSHCTNRFMPGYVYNGSTHAELRPLGAQDSYQYRLFAPLEGQLSITLPATLLGATLSFEGSHFTSEFTFDNSGAGKEYFNLEAPTLQFSQNSIYQFYFTFDAYPKHLAGSRQWNGSSVDVSIESMRVAFTFNHLSDIHWQSYTITPLVTSPIVWTGENHPHAGQVEIRNSPTSPDSKMHFSVTFLNPDQFRISDALTGGSMTKSWSDPDVVNALKAATQ